MGASRAPHRIAVLARPGVLVLELSVVHQLFPYALGADGEPLYEVRTCAEQPGPLPSSADFPISVPHGPEALQDADTVFVPAAAGDDAPETAGRLPRQLAEALAATAEHARIASICTGAFVLAAAGLLDGRSATTHWNSAARFRARFPQVRLIADVLYVDEGAVLTSAGEAAGIDLCMHMIREDHGVAVANAVARSAVVPAHREGGQAQFIRTAVPEPRGSATGRAREWAREHLDRRIDLAELASCASMSVRTFTRRFRDETGLSPAQWLAQQRVERAQQLLEETGLTVESIAWRTGFGTAAALRRQLRERLGTSPSAYRSTFGGPATSRPGS
ncbi:GlxA family transcriptional regulator [Saccharopolyspora montiporae]|nr:helix-turn-helix domain-containing protein [Saccharopolyspora sp. HNM0983]